MTRGTSSRASGAYDTVAGDELCTGSITYASSLPAGGARLAYGHLLSGVLVSYESGSP